MVIRFLTGLWLLILIGVVSWISQGYGQYNNANAQDVRPASPQNVLIILDASDSMNERLGAKTKIQLAKDVVINTIRTLPPNVNVGLRVYGHKLGAGGYIMHGPLGGYLVGGDACRQSELLVPIQQNNRESIANHILGIQAVGKTPITYSLQQAINHDLASIPGQKTIVLVSDGRETCDGDPCDLAVDMVRSGINVKINTIGLATHDPVADDQLRCIALASKGKFYSADTAAQLAKSFQDSAQVQTSVQAKITPQK
jgi:von Willebrand factor type A domain